MLSARTPAHGGRSSARSIARSTRSGTLVGPGICRKWRPDGWRRGRTWRSSAVAATERPSWRAAAIMPRLAAAATTAQCSRAGRPAHRADIHDPSPSAPRAAGDLARRLRGAVRGDVLFDRASRGRYSTDASIYQVEPVGVLVPASRRGRAGGVRRSAASSGAAASARRGQLAVRADGGRSARRRSQQAPRRRRRVRSRRAHRDRRAGHRARRAERVAEAARPVVPGRRQHLGAGDARRHGRQQFVRLALDRLRQHGAQRARDRRAARRRHRGALRHGRRRWRARCPCARARRTPRAHRRARARRDRARRCRR